MEHPHPGIDLHPDEELEEIDEESGSFLTAFGLLENTKFSIDLNLVYEVSGDHCS